MAKKKYIRNSTAEFLIFNVQNPLAPADVANVGVEVLYHDETIWATQKAMAELFGVNTQAITKHLNNIYEEGELSREATCSKMEQVQIEGTREVSRQLLFYNLDAIISVGYRGNSIRATQFRQWCTSATQSQRQSLPSNAPSSKSPHGAQYL